MPRLWLTVARLWLIVARLWPTLVRLWLTVARLWLTVAHCSLLVLPDYMKQVSHVSFLTQVNNKCLEKLNAQNDTALIIANENIATW